MITKYSPGEHPNSLANLKRTAGPGRPKMTPEEKLIKKTIKEYMKEYLENGEAVKDFEKVRTKKPEVALSEAMDRIYGRIDKPASEICKSSVNVLIQILTGKSPQTEMPNVNLPNTSTNVIEDINE